jgi:hypothetical protein
MAAARPSALLLLAAGAPLASAANVTLSSLFLGDAVVRQSGRGGARVWGAAAPGAGDIQIDWESSVRYSELDWQEFISTRPDNPTLFRVIASKAVNSPQSSPNTGDEVIELKHPAEQGTIYAYFNRADPQFKTLVEQLQLGNWTNVPLTLRLCYPGPTSNTKTVRIAGVEGKGWLILHKSRS